MISTQKLASWLQDARARTLGLVADLSEDGAELRLSMDAPPADPEG